MNINIDTFLGRAQKHINSSIVISDVFGNTVSLKYPDLIQRASDLAERLYVNGLRAGHKVGIKADNSLEWIILDLAVIKLKGILVPFPDEIVIENPLETIAQYDLALLVTDNNDQVENNLGYLHISNLRKFISIQIREQAVRNQNPDLFSMVFSSGSSGFLKGISISRRGIEAMVDIFVGSFKCDSNDKHLIFLPLSNFQQRASLYGCLWVGASLHFANYMSLFHILPEAKPTFIIAPPIFYETLIKIYQPQLDHGQRLRAGLGGQIRFLITGMAPIRKSIIEIFVEMGISLIEAYGATETGLIAWNTPEKNIIGTVGQIIWAGALYIDEDGNIFVRPPFPLSLGYFYDPGNAGETTYLENGFIATGDVGYLTTSDELVLSGRSKDAIVTKSGHKFHPQEIELKILEIKEVHQAVVLQLGGQDLVLALVIVDEAISEQEYIKLKIHNINNALKIYQKIGEIVFSMKKMTVENRCLTRNMKMDRKRICEYYREEIETQLESKV